MPRINVIEKSRKIIECGNCHDSLPKGSQYRYIAPRYGAKQTRCMKPQCDFRPTDLSSSKIARIEEAIQDAHSAIDSADCFSDLQTILEDVAAVAREVAKEYQEASDNWAGGNGHEEFQEKADTCEGFADDLESWSPSIDETDEEAVREAASENMNGLAGESEEEFAFRVSAEQDEAWNHALEDMRDEARGLLDGFDL